MGLADYKLTVPLKLIGLHGKAGAGKDTVADYLTDTYDAHYRIAFADPLKEACSALLGINLIDFYDRDSKEAVNAAWDLTPRAIAQFFGTEIMREQVTKLVPNLGLDFWIKRAWLRLEGIYVPEDEGIYSLGDTVIISDVRFQNEYDWIIDNGGTIIHLTRPGFSGTVGGIENHASEQSINLWNKERTATCVNDLTLDHLYSQIDNIINNLEI
jgi:hypothetical protein